MGSNRYYDYVKYFPYENNWVVISYISMHYSRCNVFDMRVVRFNKYIFLSLYN